MVVEGFLFQALSDSSDFEVAFRFFPRQQPTSGACPSRSCRPGPLLVLNIFLPIEGGRHDLGSGSPICCRSSRPGLDAAPFQRRTFKSLRAGLKAHFEAHEALTFGPGSRKARLMRLASSLRAIF